MKSMFCILLLLSLPMLPASQQPPAPRTFAFTHVTIIDGTGAKPRGDQTVIIVGDRIAAIGSAGKVRLPAGARAIDGTGKFLIPGLWDMHVHAGARSKFYLPLFIANGVTGIR